MTKAETYTRWKLSQVLRYASNHKPVGFPPTCTGIFTTAGGVFSQADVCNIFNLSAALFALCNLDEASNASPVRYIDPCVEAALLKIPLLAKNSFKENASFALTLDLNYHLESFYVSRRINVN